MRRVVAKSTDQSQGDPREVSKSSRRGLAFVAVLATVLFALNAKDVSHLAIRLAPKLATVTNILGLISFVLVTLRLFAFDVKDRLLHANI